jgi:predicted amidohydrolase
MRVGFYQFRPIFGQVERNLSRIVSKLTEVNADIIVLPELAFTGYYFESRSELAQLAEEINISPTIEQLTSLCKKNEFYLVTGFAERWNDNLYNSSVLIGPGGPIHTYRKLHLFNLEKKWFNPGDKPLTVNEIRGINIGMMVCFDWSFPEVTRTLALLGADLICHPSNLVLDYCQQTMISRCIENGVFAITANRFGADNRAHGQLKFTGKSQIVAPKGKLLFRAASQREQLHILEVDVRLAKDKKMTDLNHIIEDRRPEFYKYLCH